MSSRRAAPMSPDARRAAIVEATIPLLRLHGRAVTTAQIALAAGVAEGTLFRVFPDKEALIGAAFESAFDPEPTLRLLEHLDAGQPLRELLVEVVEVMQRRVGEIWQLMSMLGIAAPPRADSPHGSRPPMDFTDRVIAGMIAPRRDEIRCAPAQAARLLRLMTFAGTHPRITDGHPLTAGEIVGILLDGIQRRPGAPSEPEDHEEKEEGDVPC